MGVRTDFQSPTSLPEPDTGSPKPRHARWTLKDGTIIRLTRVEVHDPPLAGSQPLQRRTSRVTTTTGPPRVFCLLEASMTDPPETLRDRYGVPLPDYVGTGTP